MNLSVLKETESCHEVAKRFLSCIAELDMASSRSEGIEQKGIEQTLKNYQELEYRVSLSECFKGGLNLEDKAHFPNNVCPLSSPGSGLSVLWVLWRCW